MKEIKTLGQYWDALSTHDWYFGMSDSPRIYNEGLKRDGELAELKDRGPEWVALWEAWFSHKWHAEPRPERPNDQA